MLQATQEALTPLPRKQGESITMSFLEAMSKIIEGKKVARISWGNQDYCFVSDYIISIFTKGKIHAWSINDGDYEGQDWFVLKEGN